MKTKFAATLLPACLFVVTSCVVHPPPHADPKTHGPRGGIAFHIAVDANPSGARIEVNDSLIGVTPTNVLVWGDADGTFHNTGQPYWIIRAYPTAASGQYVQTKSFGTGRYGRE